MDATVIGGLVLAAVLIANAAVAIRRSLDQ